MVYVNSNNNSAERDTGFISVAQDYIILGAACYIGKNNATEPICKYVYINCVLLNIAAYTSPLIKHCLFYGTTNNVVGSYT